MLSCHRLLVVSPGPFISVSAQQHYQKKFSVTTFTHHLLVLTKRWSSTRVWHFEIQLTATSFSQKVLHIFSSPRARQGQKAVEKISHIGSLSRNPGEQWVVFSTFWTPMARAKYCPQRKGESISLALVFLACWRNVDESIKGDNSKVNARFWPQTKAWELSQTLNPIPLRPL